MFVKTAIIYENDHDAKERDTNAYLNKDSIFNAGQQDTGANDAAVLGGQTPKTCGQQMLQPLKILFQNFRGSMLIGLMSCVTSCIVTASTLKFVI